MASSDSTAATAASLSKKGYDITTTSSSVGDTDNHAVGRSSNSELVEVLELCMRPGLEPRALLAALTELYEKLREDPSQLDALFQTYHGSDVMSGLRVLLDRPDINAAIADRAAYVLSALISRAPSSALDYKDVHQLILQVAHGSAGGRCPLSEVGRLDTLTNILKIDAYREIVWSCPSAVDLLVDNLSVPSASQSAVGVTKLYKAAFCVWLFTFNDTFVPRLNARGLTTCICQLLKETRAEKVVRVCLNSLRNFLKNDEAAETIIEMDVFPVLTLLEYEKWKDLDMYEEIRSSIYQLDQKIKHFSNFDRYCLELDKATLRWSVLHSEKFWRENVMCFEHDEFSAVRKLVRLLDSSDTTTVAVAAYDLGEFARLHPTGKKVCQKLRVKDMVMLLITNKDRSVARESLLCTQKLMLKNWQAVNSA